MRESASTHRILLNQLIQCYVLGNISEFERINIHVESNKQPILAQGPYQLARL